MKAIRMLKALACVAVIGSFYVSADRAEAQAASAKVTAAQVLSVQCIKATLGSDTDEIYFQTSTGQRAPEEPHRIKQGEIWEVRNTFISTEGSFKLNLFEADTIGGDDLIGEIPIDAGGSPRQVTRVLTGDSSHYVVILEIQ